MRGGELDTLHLPSSRNEPFCCPRRLTGCKCFSCQLQHIDWRRPFRTSKPVKRKKKRSNTYSSVILRCAPKGVCARRHMLLCICSSLCHHLPRPPDRTIHSAIFGIAAKRSGFRSRAAVIIWRRCGPKPRRGCAEDNCSYASRTTIQDYAPKFFVLISRNKCTC
jgi:hypothetical protein